MGGNFEKHRIEPLRDASHFWHAVLVADGCGSGTAETGKRHWWTATLPVQLLVTLSGCSFFMVPAPSAPAKRTTVAATECTSSPWPPIADTISSGFGAYNTAVAAGATEGVSIYGIKMKRNVALGLSVTQLVAFGAAATYGYIQASRCHALQVERHLVEPTPPPKGQSGSSEPSAAAATTPEPGPTDLPSWSAFRRVPLDTEEPPPHRPSRDPSDAPASDDAP